MGCYGLDSSSSGQGSLVRSCEQVNETLGSIILRNSLTAERLAASQEGFSFMDLVNC
jgi:hypothetical protein